ncbi:MAG: GxxExxY protein [Chloroflexota bacterium]
MTDFSLREGRLSSYHEDTLSFKHTGVTERIIKAFYTVYNALGYGFLERVYQNALAIELRKLGLKVVQEACIAVHYEPV